MTDKTAPRSLAEQYGRDFMGPIFYFCLRKTDDPHVAEDLTSDISLQVLTALHKGCVPANFPAWVWQIARNRYALWAKDRRREAAHLSSVDPDDPAAEGLLSDAEGFSLPGVDAAYIRDEELATLRRELAFLKRDWREVVVAYYIEDRSVRDIAATLGEAEGTVKSRLFRARELLKEGMNMAREFGPKSYKPETVRFTASGSQPYGWPWRGVARSLQKNILLEASGNPCTAEELAVAVGVAMPYMEEEIATLVEGNLLKPVGKRYVTNFYIESCDIQLEIDRAVRETVAAEADNFASLLRGLLPVWRRICRIPADMSNDQLLWLVLIFTVDALARHCKGYTMEAGIKHKHPNESWGFVGFEGDGIPGQWCISHNGCGHDEAPSLWNYVFHRPDLPFADISRHFSGDEPLFMQELLAAGRPIDTLSKSDLRNWRHVSETLGIAHVGADGCAVCDIPICPHGSFGAIYRELLSLPAGRALQAATQALFDRIVGILGRESHEVLRVQLPYCASMHLFNIRAALIDALLERDHLTVPAHTGAAPIVAYLTVPD